MDMRLAYRIASQQPLYFRIPRDQRNKDRFDMILKDRRKEIGLIPKISFNQVAEYIENSGKQEWSIVEDAPNVAPPFGKFFVEWNHPGTDLQFGYAVTAFETAQSKEMSFWEKVVSDAAIDSGSVVGHKFVNEEYLETIKLSKWLLVCDLWMSQGSDPLFGRAAWTGCQVFMLVIPSGEMVWSRFMMDNGLAEMKNTFGMNSVVLSLGLSFMHCKNIRVEEREESCSPAFHQQKKIPAYKFHTLDINPMKQVLRTEGRSEETGLKKALHICRGHFATYTPEHPLFGKYVGTFWKPDHVRGASPAGIVEKDYKVNV